MSITISVTHAPSAFEKPNQCTFCAKPTEREIKFEAETLTRDSWGDENGTYRQKCISCCDECWPKVCQAFGSDSFDS